jgi:hypothetical protein
MAAFLYCSCHEFNGLATLKHKDVYRTGRLVNCFQNVSFQWKSNPQKNRRNYPSAIVFQLLTLLGVVGLTGFYTD